MGHGQISFCSSDQRPTLEASEGYQEARKKKKKREVGEVELWEAAG
jgi:hypothetical protein